MSRPKLLHVTQAIGDVSQTVGGVAVVILDLTAKLSANGWDVMIAAPDRGGLARDATEVGARHVNWDATRDPGMALRSEVRQLRRIMREFQPDVVHLHSSKAGLAGRLALRGMLPTVFSPHAWSFLHSHGLQFRAALAWERFAVRWTDVVMCVSDDERRIGMNHRIPGNYVVIPNSVDLPRTELSRDLARRAVLPEITDDVPLIMCVGRLAPQKGQDVLLRAWPGVRSAVPDARLAIVGSGPDEATLRAMAPADVLFVPAIPRADLPQWILAADVLVFPSRWEGASLGVLEALQLGRPVVLSDCQGMRSALEGGAGRIVPVEDAAALADEIVQYAADLELAAADGLAAAFAYREVHGRRRRDNLDAYARLMAELAANDASGNRGGHPTQLSPEAGL